MRKYSPGFIERMTGNPQMPVDTNPAYREWIRERNRILVSGSSASEGMANVREWMSNNPCPPEYLSEEDANDQSD